MSDRDAGSRGRARCRPFVARALAVAALLLASASPASAAETIYRDDRFTLIDAGNHDVGRIAYLREELNRGLEVLGELAIPVDQAPFPIAVRIMPGRGISHINSRGEIVLHRLSRNRAPILHELTHIVAGYDRAAGHWSQEGLATYLQDKYGGNPAYPTHRRATELMQIIISEGEMLPMDEVMADRREQQFFGTRDPWTRWVASTQSASFVGYLIDEYGMSLFLDIHDKPLEEIDFQLTYSEPQERLLAAWEAQIRRQPTPTEQALQLYRDIKQSLNE